MSRTSRPKPDDHEHLVGPLKEFPSALLAAQFLKKLREASAGPTRAAPFGEAGAWLPSADESVSSIVGGVYLGSYFFLVAAAQRSETAARIAEAIQYHGSAIPTATCAAERTSHPTPRKA